MSLTTDKRDTTGLPGTTSIPGISGMTDIPGTTPTARDALLIVGLQNDFLPGGALPVPAGRR